MRLVIFIILLVSFSNLTFGQTFLNKSEVRKQHDVVTLWINDQQVAPFAYMSYLGESRYYQEVGNVGVNLFCLPAYLGDLGINSSSGINPFRPKFWIGENQYDFSAVQKDFEKLVSVKNDAKVIIRVHLDPPQWWGEKNPTEMCKLPNGETFRVSYSSEKWRTDAGIALKALMNWLKQGKYNQNVVGIHVAGGSTEEWFFHYKDHFFDLSDARQDDFRKWLKFKYKEVSLLRMAWNDTSVTFETAMESDISGKIRKQELSPKKDNTPRLDTYAYHAQIMVKNIQYFSKLVKEESDGRLLTGAFYGYHLFVHDPRRGHGSLGDLLNFPYLDYLSSPNDYRREVGIDWLPMAAIKSVQMHGKLWMAENDTRTSLTKLLKEVAPEINPPGDWYSGPIWKGPQDKRIATELLWKNAARMLAYGYGGWWFDMWGGWFSDDSYLAVFKKLNQLHLTNIQNESTKPPYQPEVVLVVDEKLQFFDHSNGSITGKILSNRYALGISGTSFDIVLRSDLDSLKTKNYKLIWYLGLHELSKNETQTIHELNAKTNISIQTDPLGSTVYKNSDMTAALKNRVVWSSEQLREAFGQANVHIFSDQDDVVYAGRNWLSIHSKVAGKRVIQLPGNWQLHDIKTDEAIPASKTLTMEMQEGETLLFRVK